jgi:hypothetical protein
MDIKKGRGEKTMTTAMTKNLTMERTSPRKGGGSNWAKEGGAGGGVPYLLRKAACYTNNGATAHSTGGGGIRGAETNDGSYARGGGGGWGGNNNVNAGRRVGRGKGWGSIIGAYTGTIMSEASKDNQSLARTFRMTNDGGMPVSVRGLVAGAAAVAVSGGGGKGRGHIRQQGFAGRRRRQ